MRLLLSIEAHEIKEGDRTLQRSLGNERNFLTRLEHSAGIVGIQSKLCYCFEAYIRVCVILISDSLN